MLIVGLWHGDEDFLCECSKTAREKVMRLKDYYTRFFKSHGSELDGFEDVPMKGDLFHLPIHNGRLSHAPKQPEVLLPPTCARRKPI